MASNCSSEPLLPARATSSCGDGYSEDASLWVKLGIRDSFGQSIHEVTDLLFEINSRLDELSSFLHREIILLVVDDCVSDRVRFSRQVER